MTKQGKLVDRAEAEAAFFDEARAMRDAWLAWPARVGIEMADALKVDARTLTQVLATYVQQHLAELGEPAAPISAPRGRLTSAACAGPGGAA